MLQGNTSLATVHNGQSPAGSPGVGLGLSAPCAGVCGLREACIRRLPVAMVQLTARSRGTAPALFDTAVTCAGMWLRARRVPA
jgi:hypothetical protein